VHWVRDIGDGVFEGMASSGSKRLRVGNTVGTGGLVVRLVGMKGYAIKLFSFLLEGLKVVFDADKVWGGMKVWLEAFMVAGAEVFLD
ncbi:hypothetical protein HDU81_001030, partial [Chytriomyces hyalinus]